jgi:hypothetical protein
VRQALLRLGAGSARDSHSNGRRPASLANSSAVRRRFVQDGEVSVEYAERTRHHALPAASTDSAGIDSLRAQLTQERQARADVEAALRDMQAHLHSCQTRLGHVELALEEARAQAAARIDVAAVPASADAVVRVRRRRMADADAPAEGGVSAARARRAAEPQPVKWWIKNHI